MGAPARTRHLAAAISRLVGSDQWRLRLWDGTTVEPAPPARFTIVLREREALDTLLSGLPERAFGRAFISGQIDVEPLEPFLEAMERASSMHLIAGWPRLAVAAAFAGGRAGRGHPNDAEARLQGRRHSRSRDAAAVRHHYDLPPEFYALWLDRTLTYSCAYFERPDVDLDTAQHTKLDLVCRKLRLQPGERLLDIGCGWGSLALHAVEHYGVSALGITLSPRQVAFAERRAAQRGLAGRAEFRLADYRDPLGVQFDAVASVGMIEHVGRRLLHSYADSIQHALRPGGRALVHGITCSPRQVINRTSFVNSFVFPDGELEDVSRVVRSLEESRLEVRDVESLREHYVLTLRHWVRRLEARWDEAVAIAGYQRARVWRLYMSASIVAFRTARIGVHQTLAVRATADGRSGLPLTRGDWYRQHPVATGLGRVDVELPGVATRVPTRS